MKNLKNCIKSYINESVWDIENNIDDDNIQMFEEDIKKFIEDNYGTVDINRWLTVLSCVLKLLADYN